MSHRRQRPMKSSMSESMKWLLALFIAAAISAVVTATIALIYDEQSPAPPLLAPLHDATDYGQTLLLPATVALTWLGRVVWKRLHVCGRGHGQHRKHDAGGWSSPGKTPLAP